MFFREYSGGLVIVRANLLAGVDDSKKKNLWRFAV
jgi:hypothetical protein